MISSRLPKSLAPNAVARAIDAKRRSGAAILDLTETNPTSAGFTYPKELLEPLAESARARIRSAAARPLVGAGGRRRRLPPPRHRHLRRSRGADVEHQRSVRAAVQAAVRCRRRGAGAASELSAVRAPDAARVRHRDSVRARVSRLVAHRHRFDHERGDRSRARDPDRVAEQPDGIVPASRRSRRAVGARRRTRLGDHRRRGVRRLSARSRSRRDATCWPAPTC